MSKWGSVGVMRYTPSTVKCLTLPLVSATSRCSPELAPRLQRVPCSSCLGNRVPILHFIWC